MTILLAILTLPYLFACELLGAMFEGFLFVFGLFVNKSQTGKWLK